MAYIRAYWVGEHLRTHALYNLSRRVAFFFFLNQHRVAFFFLFPPLLIL
jgi:hypothetical protein